MPEQPIDPKRLKTVRDNVIRYVYEHGAGQYAWGVKRDQVKSALGITEHDLRQAYMVMREQGFTPDYGPIDVIGLNQRGQEEAVRLGTATAMHEPATPSQIIIDAHYCVFCTEDIESAKAFRDRFATGESTYQVEVEDTVNTHAGNYDALTDAHQGAFVDTSVATAKSYWTGAPTGIREILVGGTVKVSIKIE
ncbi:hypothetical protein [Bradyrhizobium sp. 2S1]|uniref:hypothetical protein n=1 Tax=Bradyrhizobium sp. 2S1 TaxID=1404429 RepID=UPI00140C121A|nr:hypothetical protein [Bradyrhizobium sp. 2S1]MCK7665688.1 hypothetical protein [Bradyrhizobium sp. 2S1]